MRAAFDVVKAEFTTIQEAVDAEQDAKISKLQKQVDIMKEKVLVKEETQLEKTNKLKSAIAEEVVMPKIKNYDTIIDHLAETVYAIKLE